MLWLNGDAMKKLSVFGLFAVAVFSVSCFAQESGAAQIMNPILRRGGVLQGKMNPAETCPKVAANLQNVYNQDVLYDCINYYWHHSGDELRDKTIAMHYRLTELDPHNADIYGSCAWLLWSKWVNWTKDPVNCPGGEGKKEESVALFEKGLKINQNSLEYAEAYASHMYGFLEDWAASIKLWQRVDSMASDVHTKSLARRSVAHSYRKLGQIESAKEWYRKVLEVDPENTVAKNWLKELEGRGTVK